MKIIFNVVYDWDPLETLGQKNNNNNNRAIGNGMKWFHTITLFRCFAI